VDSLLLGAQYDLRNSGPARSAWENVVTAAQLNSILLTETRINTIMGASHMQAGDVIQKMANESASVLPANCIGRSTRPKTQLTVAVIGPA
jgi:hypothetical protein